MADPLELDLTPPEVNLKIYSGDGYTFRLVITHKNDEDVRVPTDLTGTIIAQIRSKRGLDGDPQAAFAVDLSKADVGIAVLNLTGADCQALAPDLTKFKGFWDCQWTPEGSDIRTLCQGTVECGPDVSR